MRRIFWFLFTGTGTRRELEGWQASLSHTSAICLVIFHVLMMSTGELGQVPFAFVAQHVCTFLIVVFMMFSGTKKVEKSISTTDWILMGLSVLLLIYMTINIKALGRRADVDAPLNAEYIIFGIIATFLVLEAARRVVNMSLVSLTVLFVFYAYYGNWPGIFRHTGLSLLKTLNMVALGTSAAGWGIWGNLTFLSANMIFPIILFGMVMESIGASHMFLRLATALVGGAGGGPAKVAVLGSAAVGTVTGGAPANVAVTGSFTIPAMIRLGYSPRFAGAVESVASTGGAITPPIVGATVFVMADLLQRSYSSLLIPLTIPAFLYYFSVYIQVHWETKKLGLKGIPKDEIPSVLSVIKSPELYAFIIPVLIFVWTLLLGWTVRWAALAGIAVILVTHLILSVLKKRTLRETLHMVADGMVRTVEVCAMVVFAIAVAGIIVTSFGESGFAGKLAHLVITIANHNLYFALILAALLSLFLGMGTSITVTYLIVILLVIPITIEAGVPPLSAHMFSLYYATMAYITPPIALACYVAASIAGTNFFQIGWTSMRLAFSAFLVPFIFVYKPALITLGTPLEIIIAISTTTLSLFILSSAFVGMMFKEIKQWERIALFVMGVGILHNNYIVSGLFALLFLLFLCWNLLKAP